MRMTVITKKSHPSDMGTGMGTMAPTMAMDRMGMVVMVEDIYMVTRSMGGGRMVSMAHMEKVRGSIYFRKGSSMGLHRP